MENKNKHITTYIIALLIIAITLVAYFLSWPFLDQLKDTNTMAAAKTEELKQKEQKLNDLKELAASLNKSGEDLKILELAMPAEAQIPEILVQTEAMMVEAGLTVSDMMPKKNEKEKQVDMTLALNGNYENMIKFLETLQKNLRPISIGEINIAQVKATEEEGAEGLEFSFSIKFPYQARESLPEGSGEEQSPPIDNGAGE